MEFIQKILDNLKQKINIILLSLFLFESKPAENLRLRQLKRNSILVENLTSISDKKKFRKVEKIFNF